MTDITKLVSANETGSNKSLTTLAFDQIRNDILLCRLRPEERLRINNLSERYQVGATAIREALSRLVTDGLVVSEEQRGFCVSPVSKAELLDLTQTRINIEVLALERAIQNGDVEWESRVVSAYYLLSKAPLPVDRGGVLHARWGEIHRQFHESLLSGANSPWLSRLTSLLYDKSERYRNLAEFKTTPSMRDTIREHSDLMDAVMARDLERASVLISDHFWSTTNIILESEFGEKSKSLPQKKRASA
jgi:DNA-binding GntR family transcriptional regulator